MTNKLAIGSLELESPVLLAPMAGYTDLPFRTGVRSLGGLGMAFTEMLNPRSFLKGRNKKVAHLLATSPDDRPLIHQIYGHEPDVMADGAQWLEENGATGIDINMGCPQRKIIRRGAGAGLLRNPELAVEIASHVVAAVKVPVTAKIRTGWTADQPVAKRLSQQLEGVGIAAITLHARDRKQGFSGSADWSAITEVVNAVKTIPVFGNGDIVSVRDAIDMCARTGCAGVLVGRQALKFPWIIRDIANQLQGVAGVPPPTRVAHVDFMREHLDRMALEYGDELAARLFRRWTPQYAKGLQLARREMVRILRIDDILALRDAIEGLK